MKTSKRDLKKKSSGTSKVAKSRGIRMVRIGVESMSDFFRRIRLDARKLDRGNALKPRMRIAFEDPADFLEVITPARVRLLRQITLEPVPVNSLAKTLSRDASAVRKDIVALEKKSLVTTHRVSNPGHGTRTLVARAAASIELATTV